MTASRTCRACGVDLSPEVMWCLRCYEPVRQLTPRAPQVPTIHFLGSDDPHPTSRWRRGPTTFGPVGRLSITTLVLVAGPWTSLRGFGDPIAALSLWYLLGYTFIAVLVLRHVWRRERVLEPHVSGRAHDWVAARFPRLGRSITIPPIVVIGVLSLLVVTSLVVVWVSSDLTGRYYLAAVVSAVCVATFLAVWNEL